MGSVPTEGYHESVLTMDGLRLTGTFVRGRLEGYGEIDYFGTGGTFKGNFANGMRNGHGLFRGLKSILLFNNG